MAETSWRVIVVDDQDTVRESVCEMLNLAGHEVCAALDAGEEVAEYAARLRPDIVLMDIQMPGIGGIEAARRIRALPEPVPVVFLTGYADQTVTQEAAHAGGYGYLVKPFHVRQLGPVIQTAVERFQDWRQARGNGGGSDQVRQALDRFVVQLRTAGLTDPVTELLSTVGAQFRAPGVAICLLNLGTQAPYFPARWGEPVPASARRWIVSMAAAHQPCQTAAGTLAPGSPALLAVPLGRMEDLAGMLVAWEGTPRTFGTAESALLEAYAAGLGEALASVRVQQPIAWRRWMHAGA